MLLKVAERLRVAGYAIANVDATIVAQRPKLAPFIPAMRENLAAALGIGIDRVSVKAKTNEGMGFTGRLEGLEAQAAVLLAKGEKSRGEE